ncbi:MAG: isochorismate synthase [Actinomycetota bacterium]|nr:isochorismate synthase [Actinomycetota bacterium]
MTVERVIATTTEIEPPPDLLAAQPDAFGLAWLHHFDGLIAWGEAARLEIEPGEGRFERALDSLEKVFDSLEVADEVRVPGSGPVAFGAFSFDPGASGSVLVVPSVIVGRRHGRAWRTLIGPEPVVESQEGPEDDRIRYWGPSVSEVTWLDAVTSAEAAVRAGELDKVVLARDLRVWSKSPLSPRRLLARLSARFPECYSFSVDGLIGATPELLVRVTAESVESLVLAGSIRRGIDEAEDEHLGHELLDSAKNGREHEISVKDVSAVLGGLCTGLEVGDSGLLKLANVQHIATTVSGTLSAPRSALDVAAALHPTAAICGLPRSDAIAMIRRLEGMDRARYSGPVGWVDAAGNGEWGIALRCAEIDGGGARLFAGAGIVAGSTPEGELDETRIKLQAMQSALES